jgi:lipopolysaccharide transport system ATP-binding protein
VTASISASNLRVDFPILENSHRSLKKAVFNLSTGGRIAKDAGGMSVVTALDDVSFEFNHGDRVGLLGHNGSGKTTLLRVLSGVYAPVSGDLQIRGRVASLLDMSMGLDPDATGFENIYLRGILEGLTPGDIESRTDEIAEFSELGDFLNLPVRTYSSGMMMRLAFAVSTSVDADILLMDEWLSVGDQAFTAKASARLDELVGNSSILVLATHDPALVERLCTHRIVLEHGRIVESVSLSESPSETSPSAPPPAVATEQI